MQTNAILKYAKISPYKARLVANQIRGMAIKPALDVLKFSSKKSAGLIKKLLDSAIANAENNDGADIDDLFVKKVCVDDGPRLKRTSPRAKGRAYRIIKRTSHITIMVSDEK